MERSVANWVAAASAAVFLYFLSPPLVAWAMMGLGLKDSGPAMRFIYAPAIQLYEHFPPYRALIDAMGKVLLL